MFFIFFSKKRLSVMPRRKLVAALATQSSRKLSTTTVHHLLFGVFGGGGLNPMGRALHFSSVRVCPGSSTSIRKVRYGKRSAHCSILDKTYCCSNIAHLKS